MKYNTTGTLFLVLYNYKTDQTSVFTGTGLPLSKKIRAGYTISILVVWGRGDSPYPPSLTSSSTYKNIYLYLGYIWLKNVHTT